MIEPHYFKGGLKPQRASFDVPSSDITFPFPTFREGARGLGLTND